MSNNIQNIYNYRKGNGFVTGDFLFYGYGGSNITCILPLSSVAASAPNLIVEQSIPPVIPPPPVYNVYGCTDPTATNYNPEANVNDGSCVHSVFGCTNPKATNYNPFANIDDGSCRFPAISGCTDPTASNYNPNATVDNGTCFHPAPTSVGCVASYLGFSSATGSYDEYHIVHNLKFTNAYTTVDYTSGFNSADFVLNGTSYLDVGGNAHGQPANQTGNGHDYTGTPVPGTQPHSVIMTRPWGDGTFFYKRGVPFKQTESATTADFSVYYEFTITPDINGSPIVADGIVFIIQSENTGVGGGGGGIGFDGINFSVGIKYDTFCNQGPELCEDPALTIPGYSNVMTANYVGIVENGNIQSHGDSYVRCTANPGGSLLLADGHKTYNWVDYIAGKWYVYISKNPTKPTTPIINGYALSLDAVNLFEPCHAVHGCTDPRAENYNPAAVVNDGSCVYLQGCTDTNALNYNLSAVEDNGSCVYFQGCTGSLTWRMKEGTDGATYFTGNIVGGQLSNLPSQWIPPIYNYNGYMHLDVLCNGTPVLNLGKWTTLNGTPISNFNPINLNNLNIVINPSYPNSSLYPYINTTPIYGCTTPTGLNFNPTANTNDGSCLIGFLNISNQKSIVINGGSLKTFGISNLYYDRHIIKMYSGSLKTLGIANRYYDRHIIRTDGGSLYTFGITNSNYYNSILIDSGSISS